MLVPWLVALATFAGSVSCRSNRIVGGSPTTVEQYPSIVQVDIHNIWAGTWSQGCGANILTSRSLLSAAHCFIAQSWHRRIRAGATYRNFGGVIADIESIFNHPEYRHGEGYEGDISILRLVDRLIYSPVIQQTAIPPSATIIPDNLPVKHAGWGATSQGGPQSEVLLDVQIYTINNDLCRERYASLVHPRPRPPVTERMICAGLLDVGGADACQGDSGGPLYFGNITIGIVSWGEGCANATFPGISISVAPFFDWIIDNTV